MFPYPYILRLQIVLVKCILGEIVKSVSKNTHTRQTTVVCSEVVTNSKETPRISDFEERRLKSKIVLNRIDISFKIKQD